MFVTLLQINAGTTVNSKSIVTSFTRTQDKRPITICAYKTRISPSRAEPSYKPTWIFLKWARFIWSVSDHHSHNEKACLQYQKVSIFLCSGFTTSATGTIDFGVIGINSDIDSMLFEIHVIQYVGNSHLGCNQVVKDEVLNRILNYFSLTLHT